jgi:hypothetical protein
MTSEQLHAEILGDIKARSVWEQRQTTFYKMRHDGLRRSRKPWPGAADLHFPLGDTIIAKLKPYYFEQLFATDTLATFIAKKSQDAALTTAAAQHFDYKLKQRSNLETEVLTWVDHMLQSGRSVMKIFWDPVGKCVAFDAIDPTKIIVPPKCRDTRTTHRLVHVMNMSRSAYSENKNWKQDAEFVMTISGRGTDQETEHGGKQQEKDMREGLTYAADDNEIIVWEVYQREGGKILVDTYSPLNPQTPIRPRFELPYDHKMMPFVDVPYEIKDKGWYGSRGIMELIAPFESSLCKLWNEKMDCMTLYNRPLFKTGRDIPNAANLQMHPGQILPFDVTPIQHGQPPMSFDQEMISTRAVAEQRVAMPDFGMGQVLNTRDRRTATEIGEISEMAGQSLDLRMRIFRKSLGRAYQQAWALLVQYDYEALEYCFMENNLALDKAALHGDYAIAPTGSADGVSKHWIFQKAVARFQMFNNDPYVNQGELRKSVLEADEASLVKRLYTSPQQVAADQMEDQAQEITILARGFPAAVHPADDHTVHIQTVLGYLQQRAQTGAQFDPIEHQRLMEHISQHMEALQQVNPKAAKELTKLMQPATPPAGHPIEA